MIRFKVANNKVLRRKQQGFTSQTTRFNVANNSHKCHRWQCCKSQVQKREKVQCPWGEKTTTHDNEYKMDLWAKGMFKTKDVQVFVKVPARQYDGRYTSMHAAMWADPRCSCQWLAWLEVRDTQVVTIGLRQQPSLNRGTQGIGITLRAVESWWA